MFRLLHNCARVFKNKFLWYTVLSSFFLQLIVLYTPGLNSAFNVSAPELLDWAFAILFTAITFGSLETGKWISNRKRSKQGKKDLNLRQYEKSF